MALPIDKKSEWQYRGEGNCSLAVANSEEHRVYRLVKLYFTQQLDAIAPKALDSLQAGLPTDIIEDELRKVIDYVQNVMQPLLSSHYVELPVLCEIKNGLTKEAETMVNKSRPGHRRCKSADNVDTRARTALVLPDLCFLPETSAQSASTSSSVSSPSPPTEHTGPTISIELKPKKGFLPTLQYIDSTSLRHQVCKYCMHQRLKARKGQWPRPTSYCPLDLFSGIKKRMKHALLGLIHTPQNNLKICKNGAEVYGSHKQNDLNLLFLKEIFIGESKNKHLTSFLDLVIEILLSSHSEGSNSDESSFPVCQVCFNSNYIPKPQSNDDSCRLPLGSVLEKVYSVQSLDELDIEGIHPLYLRLQEHLESYPQDRSNWGLDGPYCQDWLTKSLYTENSVHLQSAVLKVKKFLISKTVQDCSIMVAIQPLIERPSDTSSVINFNEQYFRYSISIIDLDPKRFDKIPTYYVMEQEMEKAYRETMNKANMYDMDKKCDSL